MKLQTKVTYKDIKEDFYTFTGAASARVRELSIAGIAIIWLFKSSQNGQIALPLELIRDIKLFVLALGLDLLHAVVPSFVYGIIFTRKKLEGQTQDTSEVNYNILWESFEWLLFSSKFFFLIWAYKVLLVFLNHEITRELVQAIIKPA